MLNKQNTVSSPQKKVKILKCYILYESSLDFISLKKKTSNSLADVGGLVSARVFDSTKLSDHILSCNFLLLEPEGHPCLRHLLRRRAVDEDMRGASIAVLRRQQHLIMAEHRLLNKVQATAGELSSLATE